MMNEREVASDPVFGVVVVAPRFSSLLHRSPGLDPPTLRPRARPRPIGHGAGHEGCPGKGTQDGPPRFYRNPLGMVLHVEKLRIHAGQAFASSSRR